MDWVSFSWVCSVPFPMRLISDQGLAEGEIVLAPGGQVGVRSHIPKRKRGQEEQGTETWPIRIGSYQLHAVLCA